MFGKKTGRAMSQMAKKAAPKIAQKAPAQKLPSGLVNTPTDKLNAFRGAAQKAMAEKQGLAAQQKAMAEKQGLAAQQKAQTQFAKPVPLNNAGASMSKGAAAPKTQSGIAAKYGASSGMLKSFGAKKGGAVPSKMGAVKTNAKPDGVAKKGKTKGRMV